MLELAKHDRVLGLLDACYSDATTMDGAGIAMRDAVSSCELTRDSDITALAWYYLGVLQAISNLPQAGATPAGLRGMANIAMSNWPTSREAEGRVVNWEYLRR